MSKMNKILFMSKKYSYVKCGSATCAFTYICTTETTTYSIDF